MRKLTIWEWLSSKEMIRATIDYDIEIDDYEALPLVEQVDLLTSYYYSFYEQNYEEIHKSMWGYEQ